jgi:urease accessory protein
VTTVLHLVPPTPLARPPQELVAPPHLAVTFAADRSGRTYVARQRATHPFHLCRALYRPEDPPGLCTLYAQGCAGGLFEGDRLAVTLAAEGKARAHVTTAAATIVHRMPGGGRAEQTVELAVADGALLEHWPDPLILFPGSRLVSRLRVRLARHARLIALESFLAHRLPDDDGPFDWLEGLLQIESEGMERARERFVARGTAMRAGAPGVMGSHLCQGTVLVLGAGSAPLEGLRQAFGPAYGGASLLPGEVGVVGRVLTADGASLRAVLQRAWGAARAALGLPAGQVRPK